jgi:hypothetical protein
MPVRVQHATEHESRVFARQRFNGSKKMPADISHGRRDFLGAAANKKRVRKLLAFVVLVASLVLIFVQFGPSVVFGSEAAGSSHVRAGAR